MVRIMEDYFKNNFQVGSLNKLTNSEWANISSFLFKFGKLNDYFSFCKEEEKNKSYIKFLKKYSAKIDWDQLPFGDMSTSILWEVKEHINWGYRLHLVNFNSFEEIYPFLKYFEEKNPMILYRNVTLHSFFSNKIMSKIDESYLKEYIDRYLSDNQNDIFRFIYHKDISLDFAEYLRQKYPSVFSQILRFKTLFPLDYLEENKELINWDSGDIYSKYFLVPGFLERFHDLFKEKESWKKISFDYYFPDGVPEEIAKKLDFHSFLFNKLTSFDVKFDYLLKYQNENKFDETKEVEKIVNSIISVNVENPVERVFLFPKFYQTFPHKINRTEINKIKNWELFFTKYLKKENNPKMAFLKIQDFIDKVTKITPVFDSDKAVKGLKQAIKKINKEKEIDFNR